MDTCKFPPRFLVFDPDWTRGRREISFAAIYPGEGLPFTCARSAAGALRFAGSKKAIGITAGA
jgi:hypothetical protein